MDRTTKKIFKCIYRNKDIKSISDLKKKFPNISIDLLNQAYDDLYKMQLIKWHSDGIHLTNKGNNYFYNNRINTVKYILNSIIVPVIVSIITTLTTLWLTRLFATE